MSIFKSSYYLRINKYLSFHGHWPFENTKTQIRNQTLVLLAVFTVFIPQCIKMFEIRHYFHYFLLSIPSQLYYTQFIAKHVFAAFARKKIKSILEKINNDFQTYTKKDLKVLHDYSKKASTFNKFYTIYMFMVVSAYSLLPLSLYMMDFFIPLNQTRLQQTPRLIKYYINTFDNNILFIIIHGSIADMLAIVFVIGFDTLYLSISYHICALFVILSFVTVIESAFGILNLISIGCAMIPLTITGFEVLMNKGNIGEMMRYFMYAFAETVHLFYYNWPGQKIRDHSLLIHKACYDCGWYKEDFSAKTKKIMNLMMIRSQKPCYFTAGKIYILGLENFAAVMKLSMSYFTVLSSVT